MNADKEFLYDVAISFVGADLATAEELAGLLGNRMEVFLFTERQQDIAGSDGLETLTAVFERQARLVVILHREGWGETPWTRVEETAIKNRGLESGWDSLLIIPLDDDPTVPKWVPKTQIWLSYAQYGLEKALPVLERKLEEVGGEAHPTTASSRANDLVRHTEWKEERDRQRRSQSGVDAVATHLAELFDQLEQAVVETSRSPASVDIAFKQPQEHAARLWSSAPEREGTTVTLFWSRQWANTLDHSGLHVRVWNGFASAAGENLMAFEEPTEVNSYEFDFEYSESGSWVWQDRNSGRALTTEELAAFCMGLLVDRVTGR